MRNQLPSLWLVALLLLGAFTVYSSHKNTTPHPRNASLPKDTVCYTAYGAPVTPEFRASYVTVKINWITEAVNYQGQAADGLAMYDYNADILTSDCEIWVPMPTQVLGDADMDTLGHEFLHCAAGAFHGE